MPKVNDDKPRVFGYARVSKGRDGQVARTAAQASTDASDEPSNERQAAGIGEKAVELAAEHDCVIGEVFTDVASGADIGFESRPGYQKLVRVLEPGDHLVVWQLSRIDRNPFRLYRACEFLMNRRVHVHSFGDTRGELELNTAWGRAQLAIWGIVNDLFIDNLRKTTKEALMWRKANGLSYCRNSPLGKRRQYSRRGKILVQMPRRDDKTVVRSDEWHAGDCALIREIKRRRDAGETFYRIGMDFQARGEKAWDGGSWVTYGRRDRKRRGDVKRVMQCYHKYTKMLEEGKDLGL